MAPVTEMTEHMVEKVATKSHIPFWGILLTLIVMVGVAVTIFYCCCQRWWRKLRADKGKAMAGGKVDIRSVQLLGQTYKEKVRDVHLQLTKQPLEMVNTYLFLLHLILLLIIIFILLACPFLSSSIPLQCSPRCALQ